MQDGQNLNVTFSPPPQDLDSAVWYTKYLSILGPKCQNFSDIPEDILSLFGKVDMFFRLHLMKTEKCYKFIHEKIYIFCNTSKLRTIEVVYTLDGLMLLI